MTGDGIDRRQLLRSLAATAAVAAAGCLSAGDDSTPQYADWVPAAEDGVAFAYLEFEVTEETDESGPRLLPFLVPASGGGGRQSVELPDEVLSDRDDPLLSFSFGTGGWLLVGASLAFGTAGLGSLIDREQSGAVEELFVANGTTMGTGEFDTDEIDQRLRADTEQALASAYDIVEETDAFRFYELTGDDQDSAPVAVAVGEERILLGPDRDGIERLAGTAAGERGAAVGGLDGFEWLTDTVGGGAVVAGWHGPVDLAEVFGESGSRSAFDIFTQDDDVAFTVALDPESDEISVDLAVRSDSLSPDRRETLETSFEADSHESSFSAESGRFSVSGTFDEIPFRPVQADPTDDLPSGDDLPPEVEAAVPDGAIEITEAPDEEGVYRVKPVEEMQVDELTVRAIESEYEITLENPNSPNWVAVYPNADDDEIRVIATVDDVSAVIATRDVP